MPDENSNKDEKGETGRTVKLEVSGAEKIKELQDQLKAVQDEKKLKEDELAKVKTERDEAVGTKEELEDQMKLASQKAFEKARGEMLTKAKEVLNEERYKIIDEKLKSPADLEATKFILEEIETARKAFEAQKKGTDGKPPEGVGEGAGAEGNLKGGEGSKPEGNQNTGKGEGEGEGKPLTDEQKKIKDLETQLAKAKGEKTGVVGAQGASGSATLPTGQEGKPTGDIRKQAYADFEAMMADLRAREKSSDPSISGPAHEIINEMFGKWVKTVREGIKRKIEVVELNPKTGKVEGYKEG